MSSAVDTLLAAARYLDMQEQHEHGSGAQAVVCTPPDSPVGDDAIGHHYLLMRGAGSSGGSLSDYSTGSSVVLGECYR